MSSTNFVYNMYQFFVKCCGLVLIYIKYKSKLVKILHSKPESKKTKLFQFAIIYFHTHITAVVG